MVLISGNLREPVVYVVMHYDKSRCAPCFYFFSIRHNKVATPGTLLTTTFMEKLPIFNLTMHSLQLQQRYNFDHDSVLYRKHQFPKLTDLTAATPIKMNTGTAQSCLNIQSSGPTCTIHISLRLQRVTEFPRTCILDLLSSAVNQPFVMSRNALK